MANKRLGERTISRRMQELMRAGLCNQEIWAVIRREFPQHQTSQEQVRAARSELRHWDKSVLSSVEARKRKRTGD